MRNKPYIRLLYCLLIGSVLLACSKAPKGVLPEKKMQEVLVDMSLAEALIGSNYREYNDLPKKHALYQSIFDKYGITEALYDSSLVWYGKNLDVYMRVQDKVLAELNKRKKALGDIQPDASPSTRNDSVNIWNRFDYLVFSPQASYNGIYFDFAPDGGYAPGSSFVLSMDVWGLNKQMTQAPVVRLSVEQSDTTYTAMRYLNHNGSNELMVTSGPMKFVRRVYGYIRLERSRDEFNKIYIDSIRLMKYNYGTDVKLSGKTVPALIVPKDTLRAPAVVHWKDSKGAPGPSDNASQTPRVTGTGTSEKKK